MTAQLQQKLDAIVAQIVTKYQPDKVILFGSVANGEETQDGDLDFFIVKKDVPYFGRDRYRQLADIVQTNTPCDFLVYTPEEVERRLFLEDPFVRQIFEEGRVLYG